MATMFPRLGLTRDSSRAARRKVDRVPAQAEAVIATMSGNSATAELNDISRHGCSIRCREDWLRVGRFISIALGQDEPVQAIIRWTRDDMAGLEFLRPLPGSHGDWLGLIDQPFP